jgi:uncharacterized protein YkwD
VDKDSKTAINIVLCLLRVFEHSRSSQKMKKSHPFVRLEYPDFIRENYTLMPNFKFSFSIFVLLVCLSSLLGQNQALDAEKLNQEFLLILNQHRTGKGLRPLALDPSYYPFVLAHSKTMAQDGDAHHDGFEQRLKKYWRDSGKRLSVAENAAFFYLPVEGDEDGGAFQDEQVGKDPATRKAYEAISQSIASNTCTEGCYAQYAFLQWKNSKPHYLAMVSPTAKTCYVMFYRRGSNVYFTLWLGS